LKLHELIRKLPEKHERKIGFYYASELYAIIKGYLTPENFFKKKEINDTGIENIFWGEALEAYFGKCCEWHNIDAKPQERYELKVNDDIMITVKPDFVFPDYAIEWKCPVKPLNEIPDRYFPQLEAEYQAVKKPLYLGVFQRPITFFLYEPSEERWEQIKNEVIKFHNRLIKLNNKYG